MRVIGGKVGAIKLGTEKKHELDENALKLTKLLYCGSNRRVAGPLISPLEAPLSRLNPSPGLLVRPSIARFAAACLLAFPSVVVAQSANDSALHWRQIGPTRAGRARALAGVPSQPNVFYAGFDNGGVWRSTDFGSTWVPIFDGQPTGSIGAIAVAPSDPNIIYVGTGAGIIRPDLAVGDGMYKSIDGGKTWQHLGLRDSQMIAMIDVDPTNPNRLFVAALGHPYGPESAARHLPVDQRRPGLREGAVQGRVHERQRRAHRCVQSQHRVRHALAAAAELHRGARRSAVSPTASSSRSTAARRGSSSPKVCPA
jgi:hypothetical protein